MTRRRTKSAEQREEEFLRVQSELRDARRSQPITRGELYDALESARDMSNDNHTYDLLATLIRAIE